MNNKKRAEVYCVQCGRLIGEFDIFTPVEPFCCPQCYSDFMAQTEADICKTLEDIDIENMTAGIDEELKELF